MISLPLQGVGAAGAGAHDSSRSPQSPPAAADAPAATAAAAPSTPVSPTLSAAAAAQGGLAPLLADLEAALSAPDLPAEVRAAAEQVLGFGLDADRTPTGADIQALSARSGLFLEAQLGQGAAPGGDFKAMLLTLARALQDWAADGRSGGASPRPAPAPPFAGGPVCGQAAASAGIDADTPAGVMAGRLAAETQAALSRQVLMQSASACDPAKAAQDGRPEARWLFELPLSGPQGRSVAQFEIARDGRRGGETETGQTWRTRFSLDVEGVGPVHAALSLAGARLHVALWAEDPATQADLAARQDRLRADLQGEGLSAEVSVRPGAPPTPAPPAGRFMDTAA
jgi:hypothetical protein